MLADIGSNGQSNVCLFEDSDITTGSRFSTSDTGEDFNFRSVSVAGNMNMVSTEGEPALISPSMNKGEFNISWDTNALGEPDQVGIYLAPQGSLENAEKITSFSCDDTRGEDVNCDSEQITVTCSFDQSSLVSCGAGTADVLSAFDTDQLPAEGYVVFEIRRASAENDVLASFKVKFN